MALVGVSVWDVGAVYQNFTGFWGGGRGIVRARVIIHASRRKVFFFFFCFICFDKVLLTALWHVIKTYETFSASMYERLINPFACHCLFKQTWPTGCFAWTLGILL